MMHHTGLVGGECAAYYLEYWNVPEKIRAAKLAGAFEATISRAS